MKKQLGIKRLCQGPYRQNKISAASKDVVDHPSILMIKAHNEALHLINLEFSMRGCYTVSASNVIAPSVPHTHPQGLGKDSWIGKSLGVSQRLILRGREIVDKEKLARR